MVQFTNSSWTALWQEAVAPDEPHKFARRLSWDGLSEEEFETWLKSDCTDPKEGSSAWATRLALVSELLKEAWDLPLVPVSSDEDQLPFLDLWQPLHAPAIGWLQEQIGSTALDGRIALAAWTQLVDGLMRRLCFIGEQVLWSCFSSERTPGTMLLAHLGAAGDGSGSGAGRGDQPLAGDCSGAADTSRLRRDAAVHRKAQRGPAAPDVVRQPRCGVRRAAACAAGRAAGVPRVPLYGTLL